MLSVLKQHPAGQNFQRCLAKVDWALIALLVGFSFWVGCASPNVNPSSAAAQTAYVDFYEPTGEALSWDVQRFDASANRFEKAFSEIQPLEGKILRLGFPPGPYRFRVTFMNRVILEPAVVEVDLKEGMIVPVQVLLSPEGNTLVETKERRLGGTARGHYGRSTKYSSDAAQVYRLSTESKAPLPYAAKERMSYAR